MAKTTTSIKNPEKEIEAEKTVECPLCKMTETQFLCDVDSYQIWRCARCSLDFVAPPPSDEFLQNYYDQQNYFEHCKRGGYEDYDEQTQNVIPTFLRLLEEYEITCNERYILDVGCAYGTHLALAAERGWKAFGVELSAYARQIAAERHGDKLFVVDSIDALPAKEFDLIVMFDVIEHLKDPFSVFLKLFDKGAIGPKTQIVITTPNARSYDAIRDPAKWSFMHPPSHLVFYSAEALQLLMRKIQFRNVWVSGLYSNELSQGPDRNDESSVTNHELQAYLGLLCQASGNEFKDFKHFSKHVFAQKRIRGAKVLDFAFRAGYGPALLADTAQDVFAVNIDPAAQYWVSRLYKKPNLKFQFRADFGEGLASESFDVITCFETFEYLDGKTQSTFLENARRILASGGELLISSPNPAAVNSASGNLPAMSESEFKNLLGSYFRHVKVLEEWKGSGITFADRTQTGKAVELYEWNSNPANVPEATAPSGYVAICSQQPIRESHPLSLFDSAFDHTAATLALEKGLRRLQVTYHGLQEIARNQEKTIAEHQGMIDSLEGTIDGQQQTIDIQQGMLTSQQEALDNKEEYVEVLHNIVRKMDRELNGLKNTRIYRLREVIHNEPLSARKLFKIGYLLGGMVAPASIKRRLRPSQDSREAVAPRESEQSAHSASVSVAGGNVPAGATSESATLASITSEIGSETTKNTVKPYEAKIIDSVAARRPRILHVIANFMTGGSSRLVVDLFERLGHVYEQEVITKYNPAPPSYTGLPIHEFREGNSGPSLSAYLSSYRPELAHLHYWGGTDKGWYASVLGAIQKQKCKIIENINTPVEPMFRFSIGRYVYVSEYVRATFGGGNSKGMTIYPGSDFEFFNELREPDEAANCIGMVYRLEPDKLDKDSIDVFIKVIHRRPQTKALIVGGGTFLDSYKMKTYSAGVAQNITFTGYVPYAELPAMYEKMSIFVAPVWQESFGHVTPLAMNLGIPVVGYDVGGLPEIVGDRELLAPAGNAEALSNIIIELLKNPDERRKIGLRNRERAQKLFSIESMIDAYRRLYLETLGASQ